MSQMKKMKKMGEQVTKDFQRTTIRIDNLDVVQMHALSKNESFNRYINRLIKEDILRNGDEYIVTRYFKKEHEPR